LEEKNRVTPSVAATGDTNPSDATASLTRFLNHCGILQVHYSLTAYHLQAPGARMSVN